MTVRWLDRRRCAQSPPWPFGKGVLMFRTTSGVVNTGAKALLTKRPCIVNFSSFPGRTIAFDSESEVEQALTWEILSRRIFLRVWRSLAMADRSR
jgi:hypothetical protein